MSHPLRKSRPPDRRGSLKSEASLGSEPKGRRVVEPEDAREDLGGETGGDGPSIWFSELRCQLVAVVKGDWRGMRVERGCSPPGTVRTAAGAIARTRTQRPAVRVAAELAPFLPKAVTELRLFFVEEQGLSSEYPSPRVRHGRASAARRAASSSFELFARSEKRIRTMSSEDHSFASVEMRLYLRAHVVEVVVEFGLRP